MALTRADAPEVDDLSCEDSSNGEGRHGDAIAVKRFIGRLNHQWLLVAITMASFPIIYMWPALMPGTRTHLRSPQAEPDLLTDIDGAIWLARALRSMPFPWSASTVTAMPSGESIWRWQAISQALQVTSLWGLTRVFDPALSVNIFVLLGWIITGIGGYVLARVLGAGNFAALGAGVICQMLPSMPTMSANYTSYVYIGVPLLVLAAVIVATTDPTWAHAGVLATSLVITAIFDPYWLFFSLAMLLVAAAVNARKLLSWFSEQRLTLRVVLLVGLAAPIALVGAVAAADQLAPTGSRPLEVASGNLVDAGLRGPADWFRWSYEGAGILIPVLAIGYTIQIIRRRTDQRGMTLVAVGALLVALSTRTKFTIGLFEIGSLAEYARFAMPGVRFFQRAALIAEAAMCVLAVLAIRELCGQPNRVRHRWFIGAAAVGLVITSLAPWNGRAFFQPSPAFATVRQILGEEDGAIAATLPADRVGRSWFEFSLLDVATVNALADFGPGQTVERAASQGPGALAAHLESLGATHLLAVDGPDGFPLRFGLEPPRFVPLTSFQVSGFEHPAVMVTVYGVHALDGDRFCESCPGLRRAYLNGGNYPLEELGPGNTAWWMFGPYSELSLQTYGAAFEGTVRIRIGNTPCGDPRTVEIRSGSTRRVVTLTGQEIAEVDLPVDSRTLKQPIEFSVDGETCRIDGDNRVFRLQVFQPELIVDE